MTDVDDFFPDVQPLDDPGADPGDKRDLDFPLQSDKNDPEPPEDLWQRVRERLLESNKKSLADKAATATARIPKKTKKAAEIDDAFPLEPRSTFWRKLLTKSSDGQDAQSPAADQTTKSVVSYVAFNPADKDSLVSKKKDLVLNPKLRKALDATVAGDQVHVIERRVGKHTLKKAKKAEREKSKGDGWFGMSAPEMTEETKRDLQVLKMRAAVDPKRFYKKNDSQTLPKYFQIGQVVDSPVDYYSTKGTSKKKKSLVDELMADAEYQKYSKRKYAEIIEEKAKLDPRNRHSKHKKKKAKLKE